MNGRQSMNSYQEDLLWGVQIEGILLGAVWFAFLLYVLLRTSKAYPRTLIVVLFSTKVIAAFLLQALFTYYYTDRSTADIYRFFDDGMILREALFVHPPDFLRMIFGLGMDDPSLRSSYFEVMNAWIKPFDAGLYNDNHFIIRLNALFALISFGFYEVHNVLFTFLSFVGLKWCVDALIPRSQDKPWALAIAVLFPASLLWLSGGLKEAVLMLGMGAAFKGLRVSRLKEAIPLVMIASLILLNLKLYVLAFLVPAMLSEFVRDKRNWSHWAMTLFWAVLISIGIVSAYAAGFDIPSSIAQKQHDFLNHVSEIASGSAFEMQRLRPEYLSLILGVPASLFTCLMRPLPMEVTSAPEAFLMLENILLWSLAITAAIGWYRNKAMLPSIGWILLFTVPLLILTGWVTPVFGAIMRYRAPALVVLLISLSPYIRSLWRSNNQIDAT